MAEVVVAPAAWGDIARLFDFLAEQDIAAASRAIEVIEDGIGILARHPAVGRPVDNGLRELIISHGATGYVALYEFKAAHDLVVVHKIRHQRELGYDHPAAKRVLRPVSRARRRS